MTGLIDIARSGIPLKDIVEFFGVYKITCLQNNRSYIGQSNGVLGRIGSHVRHLERGIHSNKELQEDYNLYEASEFVFEFLEQTDDYDHREAHYITLVVMENEDLAYNTTRNVDGRMVGPVASAIKSMCPGYIPNKVEKVEFTICSTCPRCGYEFDDKP